MNFPPGPPRGWAPPSPEEVLAMSLTDKHRVLDWLDSWDCTHGTHYLADYEAARDRCPYVDPDSGRRCTERKHFDLSMCLTHVPLDELDPKGASRRHRAAAKLRMEELLDAGITRLEEIIQAPAEAVAPSVRLQALQLLFDRAGLPKEQSVAVDARVAVYDAGSAAELIRTRMANLREAVVQDELRGIARATDEDEQKTLEGPVLD
jgi:hypothetical protein